jgi:hypothetical protein
MNTIFCFRILKFSLIISPFYPCQHTKYVDMDIILFYVYAIAICNNVKSASNNVAISPTPEAKAAIPKITAHK